MTSINQVFDGRREKLRIVLEVSKPDVTVMAKPSPESVRPMVVVKSRRLFSKRATTKFTTILGRTASLFNLLCAVPIFCPCGYFLFVGDTPFFTRSGVAFLILVVTRSRSRAVLF